MTPAEHYAAAERLLVRAAEFVSGDTRALEAVALAQVHATLATATVAPADDLVMARFARNELGLAGL